MRKKYVYGILLVLAMVTFGCTSNSNSDSRSVTGNVAIAGSDDNSEYIDIPLSELSSTAKFYEYNDNGVIIKYFMVLGSDGKPRTAFDACDVCGGSKGYQQMGSDIKCRNCGRVFSIDGLGTKNKGYGCWPSYLPHEELDNNVRIQVSDIIAGRSRFA